MRHFENEVFIKAPADEIFEYADNPANFSSHMNKSSWMMGGSKMTTHTDKGGGRKIGSHIKMSWSIFGINLYLNELVTIREPPLRKEWQTIGDINLLVINHYRLGFEVEPDKKRSNFRVYIHYDLPKSIQTRWLGLIFGDVYAKWCVNQMIEGLKNHFIK